MNRIKKYRLIVRLRPEGPWVDVTTISNDESVALINTFVYTLECKISIMGGMGGHLVSDDPVIENCVPIFPCQNLFKVKVQPLRSQISSVAYKCMLQKFCRTT